MKTFEVELHGNKFNCFFSVGEYDNGGTAVQIITDEGEPFAVLSVWFDESIGLPEDVFYTKTWSENELIFKEVLEKGLIEKVEGFPLVRSGFVTSETYRFTDEGKKFLWKM